MNYRHAFHAGNHADVLKHVVLLALAAALQRKPAPCLVLDTHAGAGLYDLGAEAARRTGEADGGIERLPADRADTPAAVRRLLDAVAACRSDHGKRRYPGSPWLLARTLRPQDRMVCCELQPRQAAALGRLLAADARVAVHERDGYAAVKALLPPAHKRGLVLIDPAYEQQAAELDLVLAALREGLQRWATGIYAVWYPVKLRRSLAPFFRAVERLGVKSAWSAELLVRPDDSPLRMNGSGVLVLNPPWKVDAEIAQALPWLLRRLDEGGGSAKLRWIVREATG
ncbi:MAG TPA: 23S rRNA (adenine(2030)-N(6))-methyltransferase RlmJ [Xanthomonadaceae bacterium]|nr:23S rRNA (adenine(2030)-N(6))-methyltransferase RlmJ [Xanthomonadaceae bacterium]